MKVIFDLKNLHVTSMDNAVINVGKNWIVTRKKEQSNCEKRGEPDRVERMGGDPATRHEGSEAGT
jgi:hypothetical protein